MTGYLAALWAEGLKIRRSVIFWVTLFLLILVILMLGFMVFILKDPDFAHKYGLLGTKAAITIGNADWPSYHKMLVQVTGVLGLLVYGFIASWTFGREYSDHTVKDLLALPIPRTIIVVAKITAMSAWCALISVLLFPLWLIVGHLIVLPGWDPAVLGSWIASYAIASPMIILLSLPVALVASAGRGFLAPLGYVMLTIAVTEIFALLGHAHLIPWAIPLVILDSGGFAGAALGIESYCIYAIAVLAGLFGTLTWWNWADQK